jgi:mandelate racemase
MLIAIAAPDMAMWDALAKAMGLPLVVALGGSVGPVRAYNTNGLWLIPVERVADEASALVAEANLRALKIRLGRDSVKDDLKAIAEMRRAVGDDIVLMSDFNQGLSFNGALRRLHQLDDQRLESFEEPIVFDDFARSARLPNEMKTPWQIGENIYGPRHSYRRARRARRITTCPTWSRSEASRAGCDPRRSPVPRAYPCRRIFIRNFLPT